MKEDSHNNHILVNILTNLKTVRDSEQTRKKKAYTPRQPVLFVDEEDIEVKHDFNTPHQMKILKRKLRKNEAKKALVDAFQERLKNSSGTQVVTNEKFNIEDFKKPWLSLTNDQRSNRINVYIKRNNTYNEEEKQKMRFLLVQGITGKLLESTSLKYDADSAQILAIPSLQYNPNIKQFYFI